MAGTAATIRTVQIENEALEQFAGGFTSIPNRVLRARSLTLGARMTYAMLLSYAWQENFCYPAQDRLGEDLGIKARMVRNYLTELQNIGLIRVKRQGLNRPNIYYLLRLPDLEGPDDGGSEQEDEDQATVAKISGGKRVATPERQNIAGPEWQDVAGPDRHSGAAQERHDLADKEDSSTKTQSNVNVRENPTTKDARSRQAQRPAISNAALGSTYGLDEAGAGRVHFLVDRQAEILGDGTRNHAAYVKRAAEAVRDRLDSRLELRLADLRELAGSSGVRNRPGYFQRVWDAEVEGAAAERRSRQVTAALAAAAKESTSGSSHEPRNPRQQFFAEAERRGVAIPVRVAQGSTAELAAWFETNVLSDTGS